MKTLLLLALTLTLGACNPSPTVPATTPSAVPATTPSAVAQSTECIGTNREANVDSISLTRAYYPDRIIAAGSLASEACSSVPLRDADFVLASPSGATKCADAALSKTARSTYGGTVMPYALQPGEVVPVVEAFNGTFVETTGILFYVDVSGRSC